MQNYVLVSALVGTLLPLLIAVVQQEHWSSAVRSIVTLVISAVAAAVVVVTKTDFTAHNWLQAAIPMWIAAMASYEQFWKQNGVAPAVESATQAKRKAKAKAPKKP